MMVLIIIFTCLSFQGWFTCEKVVKSSRARNSQAILFSRDPHFEKVFAVLVTMEVIMNDG